jgi:hypothetical protein
MTYTREQVTEKFSGPELEDAIRQAYNIQCLYDSDFDADPRWTSGGRTVSVGTFRPALVMEDAWSVLKLIKFELSPVRERFFDALTSLVTGYGEAAVWPDALLYLHPSHICQAALLAKLEPLPA